MAFWSKFRLINSITCLFRIAFHWIVVLLLDLAVLFLFRCSCCLEPRLKYKCNHPWVKIVFLNVLCLLPITANVFYFWLTAMLIVVNFCSSESKSRKLPITSRDLKDFGCKSNHYDQDRCVCLPIFIFAINQAAKKSKQITESTDANKTKSKSL